MFVSTPTPAGVLRAIAVITLVMGSLASLSLLFNVALIRIAPPVEVSLFHASWVVSWPGLSFTLLVFLLTLLAWATLTCFAYITEAVGAIRDHLVLAPEPAPALDDTDYAEEEVESESEEGLEEERV